MSILILAATFGLFAAFFATQNSSGVTLRIGDLAWSNIPLYLIALAALLLGLVISWIINLIDSLSSTLTIYGKENKIKASEKELNLLKERIHQLEIENAKLRGETSSKPIHPEYIAVDNPKSRRNFFERIRQNLST